MADRIAVVIVDDEPPARRRIEALLEPVPDVNVAASCGDGHEAIQTIRTLAPDLVFLDMQMPEVNGLEVVRRVGADQMPGVIFVTAHDRYAIQAFDLHALDYLLKPFDDDRFYLALERARERLRSREEESLRRSLEELVAGSFTRRSDHYLIRLAVPKRGETRIVPVEEIDYIRADGPYAVVHAKGDVHIVRSSVSELEAQLNPECFLRIHRSTLVQLSRVRSLATRSSRDQAALLADGTRLPVSRSRLPALLRALGASRS